MQRVSDALPEFAGVVGLIVFATRFAFLVRRRPGYPDPVPCLLLCVNQVSQLRSILHDTPRITGVLSATGHLLCMISPAHIVKIHRSNPNIKAAIPEQSRYNALSRL
jgi:hypothetical protein